MVKKVIEQEPWKRQPKNYWFRIKSDKNIDFFLIQTFFRYPIYGQVFPITSNPREVRFQ